MSRFNGTTQVIDIAAVGGLTPLLATGPVRYIKAMESTLTAAGAANATLQGFEYQLVNPDGTVGPWVPVNTPTAESGDPVYTTMEIGDPMALQGSFGSILGHGPQALGMGLPEQPATTLCNIRSATATPTSIIVTQYY